MNLEQTEREKYERIWSHQDYRDNSPSERLVPYFLEHVLFAPGDTLIDLGCGTGRATLTLKKHFPSVYGLDLCESALDPSVQGNIRFVQGCLWDLPEWLFYARWNWFYCCDVLEHIPTEKVDDVLDNCAVIAKGGFFQIALFPSEWFGEVLHLTVMPQDWWVEKIRARWKSVKIDAPEKGRIVAIVRHDAD